MAEWKAKTKEAEVVRNYIRKDFTPHYGQLQDAFCWEPKWRRMNEVGSELWLDTGDPEEIRDLWTREFTALTTNNTLLNRQVQKGIYDELIPEAARMLNDLGELTPQQRRLELAFILNAYHALRLVEKFDAYVSVEEHTDLANDTDAAVEYARRYYDICPERFFVKLPLSPAGVLATRKLAAEGVPVNHTLGFSARQNYLITRIARPKFVNVFLGRLNSFVADNDLGDGAYVGERATLASQKIVRQLQGEQGGQTRQIAASLRNGRQVRDLAGVEVMTMPAKAAEPFRDMDISPEEIVDCTGRDYRPPLAEGVNPEAVRLDTLWDVPDEFIRAVEDLAGENLDEFSPDDLADFMAARGFGDLFPRWTKQQHETSAEKGKIPSLENWRDVLASGQAGLDALMNLAAIHSFATDQKAMDERVANLLVGNFKSK